jgi:tetratricopeptide (TPR) repeat protein
LILHVRHVPYLIALLALVACPAAAVVVEEWQEESSGGGGFAERLLKELPGDLPDLGTAPASPLAQALASLRRGQFEQAARTTREFLKANPQSAPGHELLGAALILQGKVDAGLKELQEAVRINPNQSTAITKLGDVYWARGKKADAKAQYLRAAALDPESRLVNQRLGLVAEEEGNAKAAVEYFEKGIVGTPPNYVGVKVNLGRLYNGAGEYQKTIDLLSSVVIGSTRDALAHVVLGTAQLMTGKNADAMKSLERAAAIAPDNAGARLALGIVYRASKKLDRSAFELNEANRLRPNWSTGLFQLGETLAAQGRHKEALAEYRKAEKLSKNPRLIRVRIGDMQLATNDVAGAIATLKPLAAEKDAPFDVLDRLGTAYQLGGRAADAEKVFKRMVQTWPANALPYFRLGTFYGFQKDYQAAIKTLGKGLEIDPKNPGVLRALSLAQSRAGDHAAAVRTAERLLALQPDRADSQLLLAIMVDESGDFERARELYERVLEKNPKDVVALNNLAVVLSNLKLHTSALDTAKRAVKLQPSNPMVTDTYGWVVYRAGRNKEALEILKGAAKNNPNLPSIYYHLGIVHEAMGDPKAAKANFERALALSREFRGADDAQKRLAALQ